MFSLLIVGCGLLGLAIGSFLNVVIYRVPRHESIVAPPSACPKCGSPIRGRDNIPVVSWLLLRAKCRTCHNPISARYPLVEAACSILFIGAAIRFGWHWDLPIMLTFVATLLPLACIDVELLVLPRGIIFTGDVGVAAFILVAAAANDDWHRSLIALVCAVVWFVVFFLLNAASPRILGFGDVRLSFLLGLGLGWLGIRYVILGFFAANLIGALIGVFLLATKRVSRGHPVPYGVFLALGAAVAIYFGPAILAPFNNLTWS